MTIFIVHDMCFYIFDAISIILPYNNDKATLLRRGLTFSFANGGYIFYLNFNSIFSSKEYADHSTLALVDYSAHCFSQLCLSLRWHRHKLVVDAVCHQ